MNQRAGAWYRAACLIPVVVLVFVAGADAQQPQKTTLTLECLLLSAEVSMATNHVFDVSYASQRVSGESRDRPAFTLPPRDYDDDQPPLTPSTADQAQVGLGPLTGQLDLRVVGTRVRPD